jgi:GNAT superfamily N-acetyltransferase
VMIRIIQVETKKDMRRFIAFPNRMYRQDPCYVPPLCSFQEQLFDRRHNPFFSHTEADFFLADYGRETLGRIVAFKNEQHILHSGKKEGFFGFFDALEGNEAGSALLDKAQQWLSEKGMERMTGPENFSTNEVCGILTDGFDDPPVFMMPYNKSFYAGLMEKAGLEPLQDLDSFRIVPNEKFLSLESSCVSARERLTASGFVIRPISLKHFDRDIGMMLQAYNRSFSRNWGFVPFTAGEFREAADNIRKISNPDTIQLALKGDQCYGFIVSVPDINQVLMHIRDGKLFPTGWINLLRYQGRINRYRILIMGVIPEARGKGIELCLVAGTIRLMADMGITSVEAAYVMKDNAPMRHILGRLGAIPVKHYTIYGKSIDKTQSVQ